MGPDAGGRGLRGGEEARVAGEGAGAASAKGDGETACKCAPANQARRRTKEAHRQEAQKELLDLARRAGAREARRELQEQKEAEEQQRQQEMSRLRLDHGHAHNEQLSFRGEYSLCYPHLLHTRLAHNPRLILSIPYPCPQAACGLIRRALTLPERPSSP